MPLLLRYARDTGTIVETWESNSLEVLQAQRQGEDAGYGLMLCELAVAASTVEQDYQVIDDALVRRIGTREEG